MVDVKICGLSTMESVDAAIEAGAGLVGFVFYPRSPRHVSFPLAKKLAAHARGRAKIVALIVDPSLAIVVVVYALIIQQIEGNILVPRVMGHTVGVSPLTVCSRATRSVPSAPRLS